MRCWMVGKASLEQEVDRKTAYWSLIPHKLVGLLHWDATKASAAAEACLSQFDAAPAASWHHRISKVFLMQGGPLRHEVEAMRNGAKLCELSELFQLSVWRFIGISVVERSVESKHARASSFFSKARRFSGSTVSLNLRLPEIMSRMAKDPAMFGELTQLLKFHEAHKMRDLFPLLHELGLSAHNALKEVRGLIQQKLAVLIVYHLDAQSQLRLPEVYAQVIRLNATQRLKTLQDAKEAARRCGHAAQLCGSLEEGLRVSLLREHARTFSRTCKDDVFFSLPGKPSSAALAPLADFEGIETLGHEPSHRRPLAISDGQVAALGSSAGWPGAPLGLEGLEIVLDEEAPVESSPHWAAMLPVKELFYRIVVADPSRAKILRMAPSVKQLQASQQLAQVHMQVCHSERMNLSREALVLLDPIRSGVGVAAGSTFCWDANCVGEEDLLSDWLCWDVSPTCEFVVVGRDRRGLQNEDLCLIAPLDSQAKSMAVVQGMVLANAFFGQGSYIIGSKGSSLVDDEQRSYLESLRERGLAVHVAGESGEDEQAWQFTSASAKCLQACLVLRNPRSVSQARTLPAQKSEWTAFELLTSLEQDGWVLVHGSASQCAQEVLKLEEALWVAGPAQTKRILFEKGLHKNYLLVLAHVKALAELGVTEILYGQQVRYYSSFFDENGHCRNPIRRDSLRFAVLDGALNVEMDVVAQSSETCPVPPRKQRKISKAVKPAGPAAPAGRPDRADLAGVGLPELLQAPAIPRPPAVLTKERVSARRERQLDQDPSGPHLEVGELLTLDMDLLDVLSEIDGGDGGSGPGQPPEQPPENEVTHEAANIDDLREGAAVAEASLEKPAGSGLASPEVPSTLGESVAWQESAPSLAADSVASAAAGSSEQPERADAASTPAPEGGSEEDAGGSDDSDELGLGPSPAAGPARAHPRRLAEEVVGFWYDDDRTQLSHKFTHKSSNDSWQVRCSYHQPLVNERGNKTHCTRTMPVRVGEVADNIIRELKRWISAAPDYPDKAAHQRMPFRQDGAQAQAAGPQAAGARGHRGRGGRGGRGGPRPNPKPKARAAEVDGGGHGGGVGGGENEHEDGDEDCSVSISSLTPNTNSSSSTSSSSS